MTHDLTYTSDVGSNWKSTAVKFSPILPTGQTWPHQTTYNLVHDLEMSHDVMALQGQETVCMQLLNNETDSTTAAY